MNIFGHRHFKVRRHPQGSFAFCQLLIATTIIIVTFSQNVLAQSTQATADRFTRKLRAYDSLKKSDFNTTLNLCRDILKHAPEDVEVRRYQGIARYHTGSIGNALDDLQYCVKTGNELPVDHLYIGDCMFSSGKYKEAIGAYKKSITLEPQKKAGYEGLVRTYQAAGHEKFAKDVIKRAKQWGHNIELPENKQLAGVANYGS